MDLTALPQVRDESASLSAFAICDNQGLSQNQFHQGETAHFYYEFEIHKDLAVPVGGLVIYDDQARAIHGKNGFQFGLKAPAAVKGGSRVKFHHSIQLEISSGEYWVSVGLVSISPEVYDEYLHGKLTHVELQCHVREHCRVRLRKEGCFAVKLSPDGKLPHHGLVNLPSRCQLMLGEAAPRRSAPALGHWPDGISVPWEAAPVASPISGVSEPGCNLVYLSSYPRSGNGWVRNLLEHYFDRRVASLYHEPGGSNLEIREDGSYGDFFVSYQTQFPPIRTLNRLVHNCGHIFSPALRSSLASRIEKFFLKTHELPYEEYFPGEGMIFIVRHPGAVFWSYYHFLQKTVALSDGVFTMDQVIRGETPAGSWSVHTHQWLGLAQTLKERFLLLHYDELFHGEGTFCRRVSKLTGLPRQQAIGTFPGFDHWQKIAPTVFRKGQKEAWKENLSHSQKELVWECHREMMQHLGFTME